MIYDVDNLNEELNQQMKIQFELAGVCKERDEYRQQLNRLMDDTSTLRPKHEKLESQYRLAIGENEQLSIQVTELQMKVNEMRTVIIDEQIIDDEDEMDKLELTMNACSSPTSKSKRSSPERAVRSKRTDKEIKEHAQMLNYECEETDQLPYNEERRYMEQVEHLVQNKVNEIGEEQALALIGIRQEFYRRDLTIRGLLEDLDECEGSIQKLKRECEELTDTVIGQHKYNQSLLKEKKRLEYQEDEVEQEKFVVPKTVVRKFSVQSVNSNHEMNFGSEYSPRVKFENQESPFNEEFINDLLAKQKDRSSIMSHRERKSSIMLPKKLNTGLALATDLATGPMTSRERASNMFNFLP